MIEKFHKCCQIIIENRDKKALNYAVGYSKHGLKIQDNIDAGIQALYILSNLHYWRGNQAREVKKTLKEVAEYAKTQS